MEYWLEDASLMEIRKAAGVEDPSWLPPVRTQFQSCDCPVSPALQASPVCPCGLYHRWCTASLPPCILPPPLDPQPNLMLQQLSPRALLYLQAAMRGAHLTYMWASTAV